MTQKERLTELISIASEFTVVVSGMTIEEQRRMISQQIAAALLANGVIVPPCKVGDTVYVITELKGIVKGRVNSVLYSKNRQVVNLFYIQEGNRAAPHGVFFSHFGKSVFLTREEAEAELERRENGY